MIEKDESSKLCILQRYLVVLLPSNLNTVPHLTLQDVEVKKYFLDFLAKFCSIGSNGPWGCGIERFDEGFHLPEQYRVSLHFRFQFQKEGNLGCYTFLFLIVHLFFTFIYQSLSKLISKSRSRLLVKHEYLWSRASICLSLSSTSSVTSQIRDITAIKILVLTSWIWHPRILNLKRPKIDTHSAQFFRQIDIQSLKKGELAIFLWNWSD